MALGKQKKGYQKPESTVEFPVTITSMKPQSGNAERVNIYHQHTFVIGVSSITVKKHGLHLGQELDEKLYEELLHTDVRYKIKDKVANYLSRRAHSRRELLLKCIQYGYPESAVNEVLNEYSARGWIDDLKFAESFGREKISKQWGPQKIRAALYKKGIQKQYIERVFQNHFSENDERDAMFQALKKKKSYFLREEDERKRQVKLYRFLASRGFTSELISSNLQSFIQELDK